MIIKRTDKQKEEKYSIILLLSDLVSFFYPSVFPTCVFSPIFCGFDLKD